MTLVTVQSFGLRSAGGGPRILRALAADPPRRIISVVTGRTTDEPQGPDEIHVPLRPALPTDGTRLHHLANTAETVLAPLATRRLARALHDLTPAVVHGVAHGPDCWIAFSASRRLGLPFVLTVHDDLRYLLRDDPLRAVALRRLGRVWREADARIVIAEAMGKEYDHRYGARSWTTVTDGLKPGDLASVRSGAGLRVYFAGLFHRGYRANLWCFSAALNLIAQGESQGAPTPTPTLTLRCGSLADPPSATYPLTILPFGPESVVQEDLRGADLLYLPLMFQPEYRDMTDFSLSTKLVTYLGSGIPIVYHGPPRGAAYDLLAAHDAAILLTSEDPTAIAEALCAGARRGERIAGNALHLARASFMLTDQRERFWATVERVAQASRSRTNAPT